MAKSVTRSGYPRNMNGDKMKLDNIWKVKPIKVKLDMSMGMGGADKKPVKIISLTDNSMGFGKRAHTLPDSGGQREPTAQDIARYKKHGDKWVNDICMQSLRTHKQDVLHGGKSLNILLSSKRKSKDFDIYSPMEKTRARDLESKLDKKCGANLFETHYVPIPKGNIFAPVDKSSAKELYRIMTPNIHNDSDVDLMHRQPGLDVVKKGGISHESLPSQYQKTLKSIMHPMRMMKGAEDKKRIEQFYKDKGQELPRQQYDTRGVPIIPTGQDSDMDGVPDVEDCEPLNPNAQGLSHEIQRFRKAKEEMEWSIEHGMEPSEETKKNYYQSQEYINNARASAEMGMEQGIHDVSEHIKELPGQFRENIKGVGKEIQKGFSASAKQYVKRDESRRSDPYQTRAVYQNKTPFQPTHPMESSIHRGYARAVDFPIKGFQGKFFGTSSTPDLSFKQPIPRYVAFHPKTVGSPQGFVPHRAPLPEHLRKYREKRNLARLYLRQQARAQGE